MSGFLDKKTRILDVVLTNYGKGLLTKGDLNFCYWVAFDDEIDYSPFIAESGSLTSAELSSSILTSIENTPIREAVAGYPAFNANGSDFTNVRSPLFTRSQGQNFLPRARFPESASREVNSKQRMVQRVFPGELQGKIGSMPAKDLFVERFDPTTVELELSYEKDSFPNDFQPEGFHVTFFKSGSSGFSEVSPKRDMDNNLSLMNDMKVSFSKKE